MEEGNIEIVQGEPVVRIEQPVQVTVPPLSITAVPLFLADAEKVIQQLGLAATEPQVEDVCLHVEDIAGLYEKSLSADTATKLSTSYKKVVGPVGPVEPTYKTLFLCATVKKEEHIAAAAIKLLAEVETLALYDVLLGHLAKLSVLKLFSGDIADMHVEGGWCVYIFPTVKFRFDASLYSESFDMFFHCQEGSVGQIYEPDQAALDMAAAMVGPAI